MKTVNELCTDLLNEDTVGISPLADASDGLDGGSLNAVQIHDLSDPEALDLLGTYISTIAERDYINPHSAVSHLRNRLSVVGLYFQAPKIPKEVFSMSIPSIAEEEAEEAERMERQESGEELPVAPYNNNPEYKTRVKLNQYGGTFDPYEGKNLSDGHNLVIEFTFKKYIGGGKQRWNVQACLKRDDREEAEPVE